MAAASCLARGVDHFRSLSSSISRNPVVAEKLRCCDVKVVVPLKRLFPSLGNELKLELLVEEARGKIRRALRRARGTADFMLDDWCRKSQSCIF